MADGYRVLPQRQSSQLTQDARFIDVMEVPVITDAGSSFTLYIPTDKYTVEYVRARIEERLHHTVAIENL